MCGAAGQWKPAQDVFEQMLPCGCKPDAVTYGLLISAYDRGNQWCRAVQVGAGARTRCRGCERGCGGSVPELLCARAAERPDIKKVLKRVTGAVGARRGAR